jgi:hypothetical protein
VPVFFFFLIFHFVRPRVRPDCSIMKNHSGGLLGEKLPFYQKVLNMTLGISQSSASTRKAEEPLAPSPFRRGYTRAAAAASAVGRPGIPVTPIHVVTTTPGHPAHMGTGGGTTTTPVTPSTPTKHGSTAFSDPSAGDPCADPFGEPSHFWSKLLRPPPLHPLRPSPVSPQV